jgi:hypothetical protein
MVVTQAVGIEFMFVPRVANALRWRPSSSEVRRRACDGTGAFPIVSSVCGEYQTSTLF